MAIDLEFLVVVDREFVVFVLFVSLLNSSVMRSGEISGSKKETGTRHAFGCPFLSTTNTSPSLATLSKTSPGEPLSSIIVRVLKSIFKLASQCLI